MLHLIPAPLHRVAYRIAHALRRRWWRIRKPHLAGCRVVVMDGAGQVLLIRHSYGSGKWMLPGGGLNHGEAAMAAALRELDEETGCGLIDPVEVAIIDEVIHGAGNCVHVICGWTTDSPVADGREIIEARFFPAETLPDNMPLSLSAGLPGWITAGKAARPGA